jgi:hypothetical protein
MPDYEQPAYFTPKADRPNWKRILLASVLLLSAACSTQINPLSFSAAPTPTCTWGWGPYIGKEIPELTNAWKEAFGETGLEAKDLKVEGVGETSFSICNGKTSESWGAVYKEIKATIIVDDVKALGVLGNAMERIYPAVKILTAKEKDLAKANLAILFVSRKDKNEVLRRNCNHVHGIILMEQGKNGKELFQATCSQ